MISGLILVSSQHCHWSHYSVVYMIDFELKFGCVCQFTCVEFNPMFWRSSHKDRFNLLVLDVQ